VWNRDINACDSLIVVNTGSGAEEAFAPHSMVRAGDFGWRLALSSLVGLLKT
jgi:hypothetical protein